MLEGELLVSNDEYERIEPFAQNQPACATIWVITRDFPGLTSQL